MTDISPTEPPRDDSENEVNDIARLRGAFGGAMGGTRPDDPPEQVGPYKLLAELGRGGMGSVYKALDSRTDGRRVVALKLMRSSIAGEDVIARFEQERRVLAGLDHPNIARLYDADSTPDGRPYFVMELIDGLPIDEYCDQQRVPIAKRLRIFSKVCSAVHHAHQNLVVHRDIKPANILVTPSGDPKLLDFGIAKLLNPALVNAEVITRSHLRIMTPEYASPEQVRGGAVNVQSDIYSLGVLLYELLCGHRPYQFQRRIEEEIVRIVCETEPDRPSTALTREEVRLRQDGTTETLTPNAVAMRRADRIDSLRRNLIGDLDDIVLMAMEKSPDRRYASALQFSEDVVRYLDGHPVHARRTSARAIYNARKFVKRHKIAVASSVAATLVIVTSSALTALQWREASIANASAAEAARAQSMAAQDQLAAERRAGAAEQEVRFVAGLASTLFDTGTSILNYDLSPSQREKYWQSVLNEFDSLIESTDAANSSVVHLLRGRAHKMLADSYGGTIAGNMGNFQRSLEGYSQAIDDLQAAGADSDVAPIAAPELVEALIGHGNALRRLKRLDEADGYYREASEAAEKHLESNPDTESARRVGKALFVLAQNHVQQGRFNEAMALMTKELDSRRARTADEPENLNYRRDLAVLLYNTGEIMRELGRSNEARARIEETLQLWRELLELRPTTDTLQRSLALTLYSMALLDTVDGDIDEAQRTANQASEILRTLIDRRRDDARTLSTLCTGLLYIASTAAEHDQLALAESFLEQARTAVRQLAIVTDVDSAQPEHPALPEYEASLSLIEAELILAREQQSEAADLFALARDRFATQLVDDRGSVFLRRRLGQAWLGLADAYAQRLEDPTQARIAENALDEAERILRSIAETGLPVDWNRIASIRQRLTN